MDTLLIQIQVDCMCDEPSGLYPSLTMPAPSDVAWAVSPIRRSMQSEERADVDEDRLQCLSFEGAGCNEIPDERH